MEKKEIKITGKMISDMTTYLNEYFIKDLADGFKEDYDLIYKNEEELKQAIEKHMRNFEFTIKAE